MRLKFKQAHFMCLAILILLMSATSVFAQETDFEVQSTSLQVYRDGLVRVTQTLAINETLPVVTIPLLGAPVENLLVVDENETAVDYQIIGAEITIYSFGATNVTLQYDTGALTAKQFDVWSLVVDTPYNITVVLPDESTIIDLSGVPDSIDSDGTTIALSLFADQWEISYVFPLVPSAEFVISEFAVTPSEVKPGDEVTISFKVTNVGGQKGSIDIPIRINQTTEDTKTVTLEKEQSTVVTFKVTKQTLGKYVVEVDGLIHEFTVTNAPSNGGDSDGFPTEYILVAAVAAVAIIVLFIVLRRRGPNVEKIFKENIQLTSEEKDVITFLAQNDGKAFEAEIRERFPDIPRTSLWRLIRRLEKLEIVKVKKIGLENRVEL